MEKIVFGLLLLTTVMLLFGCTIIGNDSNTAQKGTGSIINNGSNLGQNDNNAQGVFWPNCDYGRWGNECEKGVSQTVSVGLTPFENQMGWCYGTDSAEAYCKNGILCNDGNFITINWKQDFATHNSEYPAGTGLVHDCYVQVPDSAKDRACEKHGGVWSKFYSWYVPSLAEVKYFFDSTKSGNLDSNSFPNSAGYYLTSDYIPSLETPPQGTTTTFDFRNNKEDTSKSAYLKCAPLTRHSVNNSGVFCTRTIPYKTYKETNYTSDFVITGEYSSSGKITATMKHWDYVQSNEVIRTRTDSVYSDGMTGSEWMIFDKKARTTTVYNLWTNNGIQEPCTYFVNEIDIKQLNSAHGLFFPTYYNNEVLTNTKSTFNGYEVYKLVSGTGDQDVVYDKLNKEFCDTLSYTSEVTRSTSHTVVSYEVTKISNDFDLSVLEPPSNCTLTSNSNDNSGSKNSTGSNGIEDDSTLGSDGSDTGTDSSNPCLKQCQDMRAICEEDGQDVTADGKGCYNPDSGNYERNCELVCMSS